jgi:hypothetical protein
MAVVGNLLILDMTPTVVIGMGERPLVRRKRNRDNAHHEHNFSEHFCNCSFRAVWPVADISCGDERQLGGNPAAKVFGCIDLLGHAWL